ncbi:MAG: SCO family protein [Rhodoferax sp.]|nr:SCO family protein [Rhodoferax sp.]
MPTLRPFLRLCTSLVLLLASTVLLSGCFDNKPSFVSIDVTGADYARDFQLPDADGRERSLKDFAGKVVVVFFGYTQCPDVCPTTMNELAEIRKLLGKDGDRLQGVFVTVDPQRDTPEVLKAYLGNFDPSFVALRPTSPEQLAATAKAFKIYYKQVEGRTDTSYTMDHSAGSYVYDTKGQLRLFTRYGMGVKALAGDIEQLLKQGS